MKPVNFKGANVLLKAAPEDRKAGTVTDMPIFQGHREVLDKNGQKAHVRISVSHWMPEAWEREEIAAGKGIYVEHTNPPERPSPLSLYTADPFAPAPIQLTLEDDGRREGVEKELRELPIPRHVHDEIFLAIGQASKLLDNTNGLVDVGLTLAKFVAIELDRAYRQGAAVALEAAANLLPDAEMPEN